MSPEHDDDRGWLRPVAEALERAGAGGFLVCLPEYRPDLVLALAHGLGLAHFDVRETVLQPLGWEAGTLSLDALDRALDEQVAQGGLVAQNVEALLSAKSLEERRDWLQSFLSRDWPHPLLVPLVLYAELAPSEDPRVVSLAAETLPEQTLLSRFLF